MIHPIDRTADFFGVGGCKDTKKQETTKKNLPWDKTRKSKRVLELSINVNFC